MKKLRFFFLAASLVCSQLLTGCGAQDPAPVSRAGFYFNTVISVTIYEAVDEPLFDDCFALAAKYEALFSSTIADSDISRINDADGKPVTVSNETVELLKQGIAYGELSQGTFDITIGTLSDLWDISTKALLKETNESMIPDAGEIAAACEPVDYHNIQINGNEVSLKNPDTQIDVGGVAKGYIADRMKEFLNENGITSGFINLGGNFLALGPKQDGSAYTVGIQKPFAEDGTALATVKVTDETVVSSGVYERYFKVNGTRYHHILDTATGYPYENDLLGVTIITDSSVDGDALSTTCFSLGLSDGMALVERLPDTEAIFITDDYALHTSSGIGTEIPFEEIP